MAIFSKKTVLLLLGVMVLLSLVVRYPLVEHERHQTDSYFIHALSQGIVRDQYASWTFHPLSYVGYYPFSYPSGVPFLLAEMSSLTGLNMELCVLLMNMAFAVIFCLAVFGLSRHFLMKDEWSLLATFFAVLASRFVDTSYWVASARGPLVVMMVLIVFVAFRSTESRRNSYWLVALMFIFASFVIHHMAVLLALFGLGYVLSVMEAQYLLPRIRLHRRFTAVGINALLLAMIILLSFGVLTYFKETTMLAFKDSELFDVNNPTLSLLLSIGVSYTIQIGFVIVFAVLGAPIVLLKNRVDAHLLFLVILLIVFVAMINNSIYVSMVIAPAVAILGAKYVSLMLKSKRRVLKSVTIVALLAASIVLPIWSCDRWNSEEYVGGSTIEVNNQVFTDATYMRVAYGGVSAISNTNSLQLQLRALTDSNFLGSGIYLALNGDIASSDVHNNVSWSERDFPVNMYIWFEYRKEPLVDNYILDFTISGFAYMSRYSEYFTDYQHQRLMVVVDNNWPSNTVTQYNVLSGGLMPQLRGAGWYSGTFIPVDSYSVYHSSGVELFIVDLPLSR